jgi:hypothetical protein
VVPDPAESAQKKSLQAMLSGCDDFVARVMFGRVRTIREKRIIRPNQCGVSRRNIR